jgi:predicted nucleic acid-binding protein
VSVLLDSNILGRLANLADPDRVVTEDALAELQRQGETLSITPQNLIEFRSFATRPLILNGLGISAAEADRLAADFEANFPVLPDTPDVYPAWKSLVRSLGVIGKQVHDARLMAVCQVHHVTHLLTFNVAHFQRFAAATNPQIVILDPRTV